MIIMASEIARKTSVKEAVLQFLRFLSYTNDDTVVRVSIDIARTVCFWVCETDHILWQDFWYTSDPGRYDV